MAKYLLFLLTLALVAASTGGGAAAADLGDLAQRQESMAEVIRISTDPEAAAAADAQTMHRVASFMKRELGPFGVVFNAIDKMPESSVADVRDKAEALDAAKELLLRHQLVLLSGNAKDACRQAGNCQ